MQRYMGKHDITGEPVWADIQALGRTKTRKAIRAPEHPIYDAYRNAEGVRAEHLMRLFGRYTANDHHEAGRALENENFRNLAAAHLQAARAMGSTIKD